MLIDIGFNVNKPGEQECDMPLVVACSRGHFDIAKLFIEKGSLLDSTASARNPLFACCNGHVNNREFSSNEFLKIGKMLLDSGIDASARYTTRTMVDMDAIAFATMWGRNDIARQIAAHVCRENEDAIEATLIEAGIVAEGNARHREKFRRERYPPKTRKSN